MNASVSPYASVSEQRRRSRLCCLRPVLLQRWLLIRAHVYDVQTFTLLTDPQSIMAIGLRFMTSKFMEHVPVLDWKTGWEVALILEALRECYPLAALAGQCDVVLVDRDGLPHRLVQPLQVDAEDHHGRLEQHRTDQQAVL